MKELILEIYSEEIPAIMQKASAEKLREAFFMTLKQNYDIDMSGESFVTPRRLGLHVVHMPNQEVFESIEEIRGPRLNAAEMAIEGFLKKYHLNGVEDLIEKDGFFHYVKKIKYTLLEALQNTLESVLREFVWPKSMHWGTYTLKWIRPIHSILCMLDEQIVPINFGHITSANFTYKNLAYSQERIEIRNVQDYFDKMQKYGIELLAEKRLHSILSQIKTHALALGLQLIHDEDLRDEVPGLVENPTVFIGHIDEKFMHLPREVLTTVLRFHQKYFMFEDNQGNVAPYFVIVADSKNQSQRDNIVAGNQKVLHARLSDAEFFLNEDRKKSLEEHAKKLDKLVFHADVGSLSDKVERIKNLSVILADMLGVDVINVRKAAALCKADLVTEMVKEFPELQGIMGYYYTLDQSRNVTSKESLPYRNENMDVAEAIRDHYKPCGPNDAVPLNIIGAIIAIADKLDTIVQLFSIGIKPTGTKDPYALRRAALGIIRIICTHRLNLSLRRLNLSEEVLAFFKERLKNLLNVSYDLTFAQNAVE